MTRSISGGGRVLFALCCCGGSSGGDVAMFTRDDVDNIILWDGNKRLLLVSIPGT
jgi:hypothetical protein